MPPPTGGCLPLEWLVAGVKKGCRGTIPTGSRLDRLLDSLGSCYNVTVVTGLQMGRAERRMKQGSQSDGAMATARGSNSGRGVAKGRPSLSLAPAGPSPGKLAAILEEGLALQQSQNWQAARDTFLLALALEAGNFVALYSLAAIESNSGNPAKALEYADQAVSARPGFAQGLLARSVILSRLGKLEGALEDVERALKLDPALAGAQAHRQLIVAAQQNQTLPATGGAAEAALNAAALQHQAAGNIEQARILFLKVLETESNNFPALYSLGVISNQQGQGDAALSYMSRAVEADPRNALGFFALGTILQGRSLYESALAAFDRALTLNPSYLEAYNNKATLLHSMSRQKDALLTTEAGLSIAPNDCKLLGNKGYILTEFKLHSTAAAVFRRVLDLNPDYEYAEGLHAYARLHSCDWTDFEANRQRIIEGVRAGKRVCNPLAFMALSDDAYDARRCAEIFASHRFPAASKPLWQGEPYLHRKKRVAFISADFREHPVGYLLIGLIEHFDKSRFETIGISLGIRDGSDLYRRYRNGFDHYLDCADKTSSEVAKLLRSMEVDIAIDLSGYTSGSRLDILSHRPAPVQMTYLGFPGTLGTSYIDYIIADPVTIPESLQAAYTEKVLYLPHCYLPRDTSVKPAAEAPPRQHFGLPEKGTVFCSFNHDYKINPPMYEVWMDLLRETPGSVLWLMKLNEDAERNLLASTAKYDIDPKRVIFATRVPRVEDHLARYRHADVFLDTYPYNGHTTASDALYAGVPVVTMSGTSFASRVAGSLLSDRQMGWSIAADRRAYLDSARAILGRESLKSDLNLQNAVTPPESPNHAGDFEESLLSVCK